MVKPTTKTHGAVIVTRVSSGEQDKHGTSPATQLEGCRVKAAQLGTPIVAEYYDAAISGAFLLSRGGMQAALADIREGRADTLICPNISRYSRDEEHQHAIRKAVRAAGGRLVFCDMEFEDTPEGDLNFTIQGGFAAYERKLIRARSMKGKRKRAEDGVQSNRGFSPYGYHIPTRDDALSGRYPVEQIGRYVLVPAEAAVMRGLLERYAAGTHSLQQLARDLNADALPTPRGGRFWRATTLHNMFKNPVYKGVKIACQFEHYQDEGRLQQTNHFTGRPLKDAGAKRPLPPEEWVEITTPAVVDGATWDRVQERLAANRSLRGGNPARVRMLSGRAVCGVCGGTMNVKKHCQSGIHYYMCMNDTVSHRNTGVHTCTAAMHNAEAKEADVAAAVYDGCQHPQAIAEALAVYAREHDAGLRDPREEIRAVDRALEGLRQEEGAAVGAQIAGLRAGASADAYAEVFAQIAARRKDMEGRRGALAAQVRRAGGGPRRTGPGEATALALADVHKVLTSALLTGAQKRDALGSIVERVVCHESSTEVLFLAGMFGGDTPAETLQSVSEERSGKTASMEASASAWASPSSRKWVRP